ncbi:MAG: hypothetical protein HKN73_04800, partial [Gemmatimonadetes bacterium]|nr:hypothetical protein [Gemmatimonadota bacterium]
SLLLLTPPGGCLALLRYLQTPRIRWGLGVWGFLAAGLLTKGPPALILLSGMMVGLALLSPHRRRLLGLRPWIGVPVALAPLFVWGWATWRVDGGAFVRWMVDWYILERRSGVFGQRGPPGAYLLGFTLFLLPWFWILPAALVRSFRRGRWRRRRVHTLLLWLAWGWLFYELIPSKLPTYTLGAYPALAFLIAMEIRRLGRTRLAKPHRAGLVVHGLVLLGLTAASLLAPSLPGVSNAGPFIAAGFWLLLVGGAGLVLIGRNRLQEGLGASAAASLGFLVIYCGWGVPALTSRLHTTATVAEETRRLAPPHATVAVPPRLGLPSLPLALTWNGLTPVLDSLADYRITTEPPSQAPLSVIDGWMPDRGRAVRYWILAGR